MKLILLTALVLLTGTVTLAGEKVTYIKGKSSIFAGDASFLLVLDLSNTTVDGLDSEEAFIEYKKNKNDKDSDTWEADWSKDKTSFLTHYVEQLTRGTGSTKLKFSHDDPDSKYRMVLRPTKIETGNPVKYSSVEMKIHIQDMATNEDVAVIHIVPVRGAQMGPMSPTVGMRVNMAMMGSARLLASHIKKSLKAK